MKFNMLTNGMYQEIAVSSGMVNTMHCMAKRSRTDGVFMNICPQLSSYSGVWRVFVSVIVGR